MWGFSELIARIFRRKAAEVDLGSFRYRAFLSYRSTDQNAAGRFYERLERYRVPKELIKKPCDFGTVPPVVGRIFRDREEFRTAEDIETIISQELSKSQQLIVFCTPRAIEPQAWVGREIELFRMRRPDGRIHAVIGDGEPPACFPLQLFRVTPEGKLSPPLAADLRPRKKGGDGEARALIKIVAGLIGVSFDDLWQRERRRRQRRLMTLGTAVAAFLGLAGAVGYWVEARSTALEADTRNTAARTYWQQARGLRQSDPLLSLHLMTEAAATAADLKLRNAVLLDHVQRLKATRLLASWDFTGDEQLGSGAFDVVLQDSGKIAVVWRNQRLGRVNLTAPETPIEELVAPGLYEAAQFNIQGTRIVLWTKDGEAEVRDTANGGTTSPRVKHGSRISRAGFAANDGAFFTADYEGEIRVWDTQSGALLGKTALEGERRRGGSLKHLAVSADATRAFVVTEHKEQIYETHYLIARLWDLKTQKVLAIRDEGLVDPGHNVGAGGVFTRDGRRLLTWTDDSAWILDAQDGVTRSLEMPHPKEELEGAMFGGGEQRIVTWTGKAIRTWDIAEGTRSVRQGYRFGLPGHGLLVDKDRNTLTAWGKDGTVRSWNLSNGAPSGPPIQHRPVLDDKRDYRWDLDGDATVNPVRMSKSGDRLLSWINDSTVRVWNPQNGLQSAFAMSHRDLISGAVFTTDDSTVLTWSIDGVLRLWTIETSVTRPTREFLATTFGSDGLNPSMGPRLRAVNEDPGFLLTWSADGAATIWDVGNGVPVTNSASLKDVAAALWSPRQAPQESGNWERKGPRIAFNRQGTRIVVYGGSEPTFIAKLWDTENRRAVADIGSPEHVTFNREGTFFATWNEEGALILRRSSDGQAIGAEVKLTVERKTPKEKNPVERVADVVINGAGTRLAVLYPDDDEGDPSVRVWAADQGKYIGSYIDPVTAVRFSPRGDRIVLWRNILPGGDSRIHPFAGLVDATTGEMISDRTISMKKWNQGRLFDSSGAWLFGSEDVLDAKTGNSVRQGLRGGLASADGNHVLFLLASGDVELVDPRKGQPTGIVLSHGKALENAFISGSIAATVGDGHMKVWSLKNGRQIGSDMRLENRERVDGFIAAANGARVLTWDGLSDMARLRETERGLQVGATMATGGIDGAVWSEELGLIVTWNYNSIRIWDDYMCEPISFDVRVKEGYGVDGAFFVPGQSRLLTWKDDTAGEWDLSEFFQMKAEFLRTRVAAMTGAEYDSNARQLRALTTERWKALTGKGPMPQPK
jgi:WD40 repeat protein